MSEVLYSGFRWDHHDETSGYHHVVPADASYVNGDRLSGGTRAIGSFQRRLNFLWIDVLTVVRAWRHRAVLVFYPEQTAYLSAPLLRLLGKRVVYVLHLGEDYWFERSDSLFLKIKRFQLRFVDKFIVLTDQQQAVFDRRFPGRVAKIPHGVWCTKLPTAAVPRDAADKNVVVVGDNYRDYSLLSQIIEVAASRFPALRFNLVGMKYEKLGVVRNRSNVICHPRLTKQSYDEVIRNSLFMVLPLTFATANNALLEALALGVPVVCNRVDGVVEYLPSEQYVFDSVEDLMKLIEQRLSASDSARSSEAALLRSHVDQQYAWASVRARVQEYCLA